MYELPRSARTDLSQINENLASMNSLHLVRVPMPSPMPAWAADYFDRAMDGTV
jgi:hypothetical protein